MNIMWLFEAEYTNMDCESFIDSVRRKIEFDGDNFFDTGEECYLYAMKQALKMRQKNKCIKYIDILPISKNIRVLIYGLVT